MGSFDVNWLEQMARAERMMNDPDGFINRAIREAVNAGHKVYRVYDEIVIEEKT